MSVGELRGPIILHLVDDPERMELIYRIRDEVFVHEQSLTDDARHDPDDDISLHYLAVRDGRPVGAGRLTMFGNEGQIAWVAVRAHARGSGIGKVLMDAMIDRAAAEGAAYVMLNAQTHAIGFYELLGFETVGAIFHMGGIPHRVMVLRF
jgi:predicted GNAT family N-acyltransferase